jgi:hypothetical protein
VMDKNVKGSLIMLAMICVTIVVVTWLVTR